MEMGHVQHETRNEILQMWSEREHRSKSMDSQRKDETRGGKRRGEERTNTRTGVGMVTRGGRDCGRKTGERDNRTGNEKTPDNRDKD